MKLQVWGVDKAVHDITIGTSSNLVRVENHLELSTKNSLGTEDPQTFLFGLDGSYYGYRDKISKEMTPFHRAVHAGYITKDHFP